MLNTTISHLRRTEGIEKIKTSASHGLTIYNVEALFADTDPRVHHRFDQFVLALPRPVHTLIDRRLLVPAACVYSPPAALIEFFCWIKQREWISILNHTRARLLRALFAPPPFVSSIS